MICTFTYILANYDIIILVIALVIPLSLALLSILCLIRCVFRARGPVTKRLRSSRDNTKPGIDGYLLYLFYLSVKSLNCPSYLYFI